MNHEVDICLSRDDFRYWWVQGLIRGKALSKVEERELTEIEKAIEEDINIS